MERCCIFSSTGCQVPDLGQFLFGWVCLFVFDRSYWFTLDCCFLGWTSCPSRSRIPWTAPGKSRLLHHRWSCIGSRLIRNMYPSMFFLITSPGLQPTSWISLRRPGWRCLWLPLIARLRLHWKWCCWIRIQIGRSLYQVMIYVIQIWGLSRWWQLLVLWWPRWEYWRHQPVIELLCILYQFSIILHFAMALTPLVAIALAAVAILKVSNNCSVTIEEGRWLIWL